MRARPRPCRPVRRCIPAGSSCCPYRPAATACAAPPPAEPPCPPTAPATPPRPATGCRAAPQAGTPPRHPAPARPRRPRPRHCAAHSTVARSSAGPAGLVRSVTMCIKMVRLQTLTRLTLKPPLLPEPPRRPPPTKYSRTDPSPRFSVLSCRPPALNDGGGTPFPNEGHLSVRIPWLIYPPRPRARQTRASLLAPAPRSPVTPSTCWPTPPLGARIAPP